MLQGNQWCFDQTSCDSVWLQLWRLWLTAHDDKSLACPAATAFTTWTLLSLLWQQWNSSLPAKKAQSIIANETTMGKLNDVSHQTNHVFDSHYHQVAIRCCACVCHNLEHSICYVFFSWIGSSVGTHVNCLSRVGSTSFFSRFWSIFLLAAKTYAMLLFINQQALLFVAWRQNNNTATTTISVVYVFNEKTETPKHRN